MSIEKNPHPSNVKQGGNVPPQHEQPAYEWPQGDPGEFPRQRGKLDSPETYAVPSTEKEPKEEKGFFKRTIGRTTVGITALAVAGAGYFVGSQDSESPRGPETGTQPTATAEPFPTTQTTPVETLTSTPEKTPDALFTVGPDDEKFTAEQAKNLGQITGAEAPTTAKAAELYITKSLQSAANLNVSPSAKHGKGQVSTVLAFNKDLISNGLYADLGAKHNFISKTPMDDYIEFGTLAALLNQTNLANNTYSEMRLENVRLSETTDGATVLADVIVEPKDILVKTDEPGTKVYKADIKLKLDKATNEWKFSKTFFMKTQ